MLYKQIIRFFEEEGISDKFEIAFITVNEGIVISNSKLIIGGSSSSKELPVTNYQLPPQHFRSGRLWITKEIIEEMADSIVSYIKIQEYPPTGDHPQGDKNIKIIAYVRGAYLEAVRLANKKLRVTNYQLLITEIFSDEELAQLKKKGIRWMKVGLRMPTAFIIFRMKIRYMVMDQAKEGGQLKLF